MVREHVPYGCPGCEQKWIKLMPHIYRYQPIYLIPQCTLPRHIYQHPIQHLAPINHHFLMMIAVNNDLLLLHGYFQFPRTLISHRMGTSNHFMLCMFFFLVRSLWCFPFVCFPSFLLSNAHIHNNLDDWDYRSHLDRSQCLYKFSTLAACLLSATLIFMA